MIRWTLAVVAVAIAINCYHVTARKVDLGNSLSELASINPNLIGKIEDGGPMVYCIQEDEYEDNCILVAAGSALYSINRLNGQTRVVAGNLHKTGYRNGVASKALFNQLTGFAQLDNGIVLISDTNNRCIRQLDRTKRLVAKYAGNCGKLQSYDSQERGDINWQIFEGPRTMRYDRTTNTVYLLDGESTILLKNLKDSSTQAVYEEQGHVQDFIHDSYTDTLAVSGQLRGVENISSTLHNQVDYSMYTTPYGLAMYDGVLIITYLNTGIVTFIDMQKEYPQHLFNFCDEYENDNDMLPDCAGTIYKPSAIAVVDGYLYIGSMKRGSGQLLINKISIFVHDSEDVSSTTTTTTTTFTSTVQPKWFKVRFTDRQYLWHEVDTPTARSTTKYRYWWLLNNSTYPWTEPIRAWTYPTTVRPINFDPSVIWPPKNYDIPTMGPSIYDDDSDDDDYDDYSGGGIGGGNMAGIIVGVSFAVILKIAFWCCILYKAQQRRRCTVTRSRIVTIAARRSLLRVQARSSNAYGRLEETPAATVEFPAPPQYSTVVSESEGLAANKPRDQHRRGAPPAYTLRAPDSEPVVPLTPVAPNAHPAPAYTPSVSNVQPAVHQQSRP